MSARRTRGSAAKAVPVDMPNGALPSEGKTQATSQITSRRGLAAKRTPRPVKSHSKTQEGLDTASVGPSTSVTKSEEDKDAKIKKENVLNPANVGKKRKRNILPESRTDQSGGKVEDLPHNMGETRKSKKVDDGCEAKSETQPPTKTRATKRVSVKEEEQGVDEAVLEEVPSRADEASSVSKKKAKTPSKKDNYGITEGISPFPNYPRPTPEQCYEVAKILRKAHPNCRPRPKTIPEPSQIIAGCGEVPSVLDAMVRTLLSAATNGRNSSNAYQGMVHRYGNRKTGVGKGSVDYNAVRLAPQADLEKAIASGGLAKNKSKNIKAILDMVYKENQQRRKDLLAAKAAGSNTSLLVAGGLQMSEEQQEAEIALAEEDNISLDHLYYLPTYAAIAKFTTYPGIGVKTAACVSLFCMQRDCFAVDTHVFRLCKLLGWVPDQSTPDYVRAKGEPRVDRDPTFSHLEVRMPDELKYDLHQLFIAHGKKCPRCRGGATVNSAGWEKGCPLDVLVDRARLSKGGDSAVKKSAKLTGKGLKKRKKTTRDDEDLEDDEDIEMSDLVDDEDDDEVEEAMPDLNDDE